MSRICTCLILLLLFSSTADAQLRRFAKPRMKRASPIKKTAGMVNSILAEELTNTIMKQLVEQLTATMNEAGLKASQTLQALDRPEFNTSIDPLFRHWTQVILLAPDNDEPGLLLMPAAKLEAGEIAKLKPGSAQFLAAIALTQHISDETRSWGSQDQRRYTFPSQNSGVNEESESFDILSHHSVILLAIGRDQGGQLELLGYGRESEPIFRKPLSVIDTVRQSKTDSEPGQKFALSESIVKYDEHQCEVFLPTNNQGQPIDHFLRAKVTGRRPFKLQLALFDQYEAEF